MQATILLILTICISQAVATIDVDAMDRKVKELLSNVQTDFDHMYLHAGDADYNQTQFYDNIVEFTAVYSSEILMYLAGSDAVTDRRLKTLESETMGESNDYGCANLETYLAHYQAMWDEAKTFDKASDQIVNIAFEWFKKSLDLSKRFADFVVSEFEKHSNKQSINRLDFRMIPIHVPWGCA